MPPETTIQRANQRDEADILVAAVQHARVSVQAEQVVGQGDRGEGIGDLRIVPGPPSRAEQRRQGQGAQEQPEGQNHPWIRLEQMVTHPAYPTGPGQIRSNGIARFMRPAAHGCVGGSAPAAPREAKPPRPSLRTEPGKTSNGYRVTHARAAASLAARRNGLSSWRVPAPLPAAPRATGALSRSSSASCLARNGAGGAGLPRTPFRARTLVGTRL